jgi:S-adenosyl-L-methionine hydrolase (adenosine-forming)
MKGVLLARNPKAQVIDLCHDVPPQDVRTAAFYLRASVPYFPPGSLFVTVVDPGVGSTRRILWAKSKTRQFLFPDNGCASWLEGVEPLLEVRHVADSKLWLKDPSATFHGRDIFAPVAAALTKGLAPAKVGPKAKGLVKMPFPVVETHGLIRRGRIIAVDRFGNAVTNLRAQDLRPGARVDFKGRSIGAVVANYAQASEGAALAILGSAGFLELSIRNGSFAADHGARPGDPVDVS